MRQLDFICPFCKHVGIYVYNEMMKKPPYCEKCGQVMEKVEWKHSQ